MSDTAPTVLLVRAPDPEHDHGELLRLSGFNVVAVSHDDFTIRRILDVKPDLIAAELHEDRVADTLDLARHLQSNDRVRAIPFVVYGDHLSAFHIESIARAGAMWLQIEPSQGTKLVGAIRGILAAGAKHAVQSARTDSPKSVARE